MIAYEDVQQFVRESDDVIKLLKYSYESIDVVPIENQDNLILHIKVDDYVTIHYYYYDNSIQLLVKQDGDLNTYDADMEDLRYLMASDNLSTFNARLLEIINPEFDVENDGIDVLYDFLPFSSKCSRVNRNLAHIAITHFLQGIGCTTEVLFITTERFKFKDDRIANIILDYDHSSGEWIVILPHDQPIWQNYANRHKFKELDEMVQFIQNNI